MDHPPAAGNIVPLFAGIYKKGAGLGPAITFLFFAPAANILALAYTGGIIGTDLAAARLILSLIFGIGIGLIMALIFRADDAEHERAADSRFVGQGWKGMGRGAVLFLLVWLALLLAGTLKLGVLTGTYVHFDLPLSDAAAWQNTLDRLVPYDASKGEEGLSVQGLALIVLLAAIGGSAWRGLANIQDGANPYVGLVALFSAGAGMTYGAWVDGASLLVLASWLAGFIAVLAALLSAASRRSRSLTGV